MNIEHFETLFSDSESDADRVWVASQKIHEALLNTGITDDALTQGLHIVIQRVNQLNYSTQFLPQNIANDIISDLTRLVPARDVELLTKFSWLVLNFLNKQTIILECDVEHVTEYFLKTSRVIPLTPCNISTVVLHLRALGTVLYGNVRRLKPMHGKIIADLRILSQSSAPLIQSEAVPESDKLSLMCALMQCYENLSADFGNAPGNAYLNEEHQVATVQHFLHALQKLSGFDCIDDCLYYKVVAGSLRGLKNVMEASRTFPTDLVGHLVNLVQRYSVLGHIGLQVGQQETSNNQLELEKMRVSVKGDDASTPSSKRPGEGSRSRTEVQNSTPHQKQKNKRQSKMSKKLQTAAGAERVDFDGENETIPSGNSKADRPKDSEEDKFWAMFELSDSDLSDGELNQSFSRPSGNNFAAKIRTQSLALLHNAVKCIDRKTMFGQWHSIFPDRFICNWNQLNDYPLFVTIIRDPSHKMRLAALSILTTLLDGSKQFLMAAEDGAQYQSVAYTPFSVSLGNTIKELHRCLLLTLTREQVPLVLVQAIKCLGTLVANSPYHRLKPGLLNRSVKFVSHFLSHKDANIKVVALTCLGKVVSVHAPLGEVIQLLGNKPSKVSFSSPGFFHQREKSEENKGESSNCYEELNFKAILSSGSVTPLLQGMSEHCPEPNLDDAADNQNATHREMSWLLKSCTEIIMSGCTKKKPKVTPVISMSNTLDPNLSSSESSYIHVVPVRVEALQVLTLMTQNYFVVVRPHLKVVQDLAGSCLQNDPDNSIQLHAIKLLEALTSLVLSNRSADEIASPVQVTVKEALALWNYILNGPIQKALSNNADSMVEMVACECLGNVGSDVFEKLPEKSSDFIKTIILGFSSVSDHHICVGALSAIGRSVNYPCLSSDALFLADASNAVLRSLKTSNLGVVTKAAWVLSNLSDALVSKRMDDEFVEKIPACLLLKLLESCIELCSIHDKPRSNALRTIGNLLNFLPPASLDDGKFDDAVRNSLQVIIKYIHSGSVKVRWNACYAFGNVMWNEPVLSFISYKLMEAYKALVKAVRTCKNFKVRISAATVLAIPSRREMFFQGDESKTSLRLFLGMTNHKTFTIGRTENGNQASSVHFYRYTVKSRQGSLDRFHPGNYTLEVDLETEFGMMQSKEKKVGCQEDCFGIVWEGILSAMLECESTPFDFTEMKYKSILMSRLIITLLHLLSLVVPGDLELCWKSLKGHEDMITKYLQVRNDDDVTANHDNEDDCKPQGKGTVAHKVKVEDGLKEVSRHLSMLPKCASLTEAHLRAIEGLSRIFLRSTPEINPDENAGNSMELKFFQVYD